MWHYTEGLQNWNPIWPGHGIRVLPAPSSLWLDATGKRLPPFLYPGSDTLATLKYICGTGYDYTWFILDQAIIAREFALSGSEQNPDLTGKSIWQLLMSRVFSSKGTVPVQNFQKHGKDFVVRDNLEDLVAGMNELARSVSGPELDYASVRETVETRDGQVENKYCKDAQIMLVRNGRNVSISPGLFPLSVFLARLLEYILALYEVRTGTMPWKLLTSSKTTPLSRTEVAITDLECCSTSPTAGAASRRCTGFWTPSTAPLSPCA